MQASLPTPNAARNPTQAAAQSATQAAAQPATGLPTGNPAGKPSVAITLDRVSQLFGSFVALREVSLHLPAGSSVVLLGPNGAGKSTLLKLLAGLSSPTYGEVRVFGRPPSALRGRIAYMSHSTMLYDELTATENLDYLLGLQRPEWTAAQRREHVRAGLLEVALDPENPRRLGEYSQGMRQRASLARVLLAQPDLLLLDEPFSNLDVASAHAMVARLQQYLRNQNAQQLPPTLLLTTHQAALARPLAQQTLQLQDGRIMLASASDSDTSAAPLPSGFAASSSSASAASSAADMTGPNCDDPGPVTPARPTA